MLEMQKIEPAARLGQFMRVFEDAEAEFIGLAIDALIMRLDERDGDADREPDGDDLGDQSGEFNKLARFYPDTRPADVKDAEIAVASEDDEDDDPLEEDGEDQGIDDMPHDGDDDREAGSWAEDAEFGTMHTYADDDREDDGLEARRPHRDRIRRTRCRAIKSHWVGGGVEYQLKRANDA